MVSLYSIVCVIERKQARGYVDISRVAKGKNCGTSSSDSRYEDEDEMLLLLPAPEN